MNSNSMPAWAEALGSVLRSAEYCPAVPVALVTQARHAMLRLDATAFVSVAQRMTDALDGAMGHVAHLGGDSEEYQNMIDDLFNVSRQAAAFARRSLPTEVTEVRARLSRAS